MDTLRPRQENFCRHFVETPSAAAAARSAGYAPDSAANHSYRLLKQPRIRARIAELQDELARESCAAESPLMAKLEAVYRRALNTSHYAAATRAVEVQARLLERSRRAANDDPADPNDDPAALLTMIDEARREMARVLEDDEDEELFFNDLDFRPRQDMTTDEDAATIP